MDSLNFPFFIYPRYPFCGYLDFKKYNENLVRLHDFLVTEMETLDKPHVYHFTIGSPFEDDLSDHDITEHMWRQMFPAYFENMSETCPDIEITNIIVSPESKFKNIVTNQPTFVEHCGIRSQFIGDIIKTAHVRTIGFYTMIPTVDKDNFIKIKNRKQNSALKALDNMEILLDSIIQTPYDVAFVNNFYKTLSLFIKKVIHYGGVVNCFSFAVFNQYCEDLIKYNNYAMFPELKDVFMQNNSMIAEWRFNDQETTMYTVKDDVFDYSKLEPHTQPIFGVRKVNGVLKTFIELPEINIKPDKLNLIFLDSTILDYTS
uniref:Uncharacterized protein n=1 Tax=viral metagenome TaxID=1070528 RepID=A0A6C0EBR8_9ZZZZ